MSQQQVPDSHKTTTKSQQDWYEASTRYYCHCAQGDGNQALPKSGPGSTKAPPEKWHLSVPRLRDIPQVQHHSSAYSTAPDQTYPPPTGTEHLCKCLPACLLIRNRPLTFSSQVQKPCLEHWPALENFPPPVLAQLLQK